MLTPGQKRVVGLCAAGAEEWGMIGIRQPLDGVWSPVAVAFFLLCLVLWIQLFRLSVVGGGRS